jgi:hypothetical protein
VFELSPDQWREFCAIAAGWDRRQTILIAGMRLSHTQMIGTQYPVCVTDEQLRHLHYTDEEWDAFVAGLLDGEFEVERLAQQRTEEDVDA